MRTIPVPLSENRGYEILVGAPLKDLGAALRSLGLGRNLLVVSSAPVSRRHSPPLLAGLRSAGFEPRSALLPDGERHKTLSAVRAVYSACLKARLDRRSGLVAFGGGVVGDLSGFAAATFMRGIPLIQVPTTLLAMVDSAIGGKTGVDLPEGKNLVGAFWQPKLVWADLSVLRTLPDREWRTGLAEVIKYGMISDEGILDKLQRTDLPSLKESPVLLEDLVGRSAAIKAGVVSRDEYETKDLRALLNLGHTFGHALEQATGYRAYTHGEAISVGMCAAARLGSRLGTFRPSDVAKVDQLFSRWGLPTRALRTPPRAKLLAAMSRDKKAVDGQFRFVVPVGWGRARVVKDVPRQMVDEVLTEVGL